MSWLWQPLEASALADNASSATGAISAPPPTVSGSGTVTVTGTGAVTVPPPTVTGEAVRGDLTSGTGDISAPSSTVSGVGSVTTALPSGGGGKQRDEAKPFYHFNDEDEFLMLYGYLGF